MRFCMQGTMATPIRTQAIFYGNSKPKRPLTLHHHVARGRKAMISTQHRSEGLEIIIADHHCSPDLAPSTSRSVYEAGFDGYHQGMQLIEAEPTRMHSKSSDDSDGIDGEDLHNVSSPLLHLPGAVNHPVRRSENVSLPVHRR